LQAGDREGKALITDLKFGRTWWYIARRICFLIVFHFSPTLESVEE